jgi:hypothetical protein
MQAIAAPAHTLSLLVPHPLLPSEGDDLAEKLMQQPVSGISDLFQLYQDIVIPQAARFVLKGNDLLFDGELDAESSLQLVQATVDEPNGAAQLEVCAAMSWFDWAGVLREVISASQSPHFLGTPEELARIFIEAVRESSAASAVGFAGEAVPLLKVSIDAEEGEATISFLGIWLANEAEMLEMRASLPVQSWLEGTGIGHSTCLLLDTAEVEGRGLKEAMIGAAMLAMVFGSSVSQGAEPVKKQESSKLSSFFGIDTRPGKKLEVKTQKLVQEAPRIYEDVLESSHCDLRVIVDIGAQRAYLVKDGQVAFETPISTASKGRKTPRGTFTITQKVRSGKMSTIYKCPLPGWMRLGETAIGMHQGHLPGYPASHGCIRMPLESALFIFDHAPKGTTVQVVDSWQPAGAVAQPDLVAAN